MNGELSVAEFRVGGQEVGTHASARPGAGTYARHQILLVTFIPEKIPSLQNALKKQLEAKMKESKEDADSKVGGWKPPGGGRNRTLDCN